MSVLLVMSAKKLVKSKSGLRMIPTEGDSGPFYIREPIWSLDAEVRDCSACGVGFSFFVRKHHCRRCGRIFCAQCCKQKLNLNRMHFVDPVLHCLTCSKLTLEEGHFFETCLRILTSGAFLAVSNDNESSESSYITKLSSDQASIVFQTEYLYNLGPIPINSIVQAVPVSDTNDCVVIYTVEKCKQSLRFSPGPGPHRQQAILWLEAFLKGTRMIGKDHAKEIE